MIFPPPNAVRRTRWEDGYTECYTRRIKTMSLSRRKFTASELVPGQTYRVVQAFRDYDGTLHPVGERWRFVGKSFLPYEDGLMLFLEQDGREQSIRLQWRDETQGPIIVNFFSYVEEL